MSSATGITAVFDCMIFLQAAISETGPAAELLRLKERSEFLLFVDRDTLKELHDVLSRPKIISKYPFITSDFVEAFLLRISKASKVVKTIEPHFLFLRDPKDEKYINLAIESDSDYLVSRDNDLRDLMTDHAVEAKEFRQRFRKLKIVDPVEFLEIIRKTELSLKP